MADKSTYWLPLDAKYYNGKRGGNIEKQGFLVSKMWIKQLYNVMQK